MRTDFDRTIDKLLRAHGADVGRERDLRPTPSSALLSNAAASEFHLDADALGALVENALPAAARAFYTAHLADCSMCRQLAASIAANFTAESSANASDEILTSSPASQVEEIKRPSLQSTVSHQLSAIRRWLAAIFAPSFLRYAVPVVIIGVVGVVSFIALRSAQRNAATYPSVVSTQTQDEYASRSSTTISASSEETKTPNGNSATANEHPASRKASNHAVSKTDGAPLSQNITAGSASGDSENDARQSDEQKASNAAHNPMPTPLSAASQTASASDVSTAQPDRGANAFEDETAFARQRQPSEPRASATSVQHSDTASRAAKQPPSAANGSANDLATIEPRASAAANRETTVRARRMVAKKADAANKDETARADAPTTKVAPAPTREIAGHRFRREGGAWIDSIYNSQRIINVARGSEQFRALAVDEPAIRQIAEELAGEVIVVLNGRAYRLR